MKDQMEKGVPLHVWWLLDSLCKDFRIKFVDGLNRENPDYYTIPSQVKECIVYDNCSQLWRFGTKISVQGPSTFRLPGVGLADAEKKVRESSKKRKEPTS